MKSYIEDSKNGCNGTNCNSIQDHVSMLSQYQLIYQQTQFLRQIFNKINLSHDQPDNKIKITLNQRTKQNQAILCDKINENIFPVGRNSLSNDILPLDDSFSLSNISSVYQRTHDDHQISSHFNTNLINTLKFQQEEQKSGISAALLQIQDQCSFETYSVLTLFLQKLLSKKRQDIEQSQNQQHSTNKLLKQLQSVQTQYIIKSSQLSTLRNQYDRLEKQLRNIQDEKNKIKIRKSQLSQKQTQLCKSQMALVFSQKLLAQGRKRYQRQRKLFISLNEKLTQLYKGMNTIWDNILNKMEVAQTLSCVVSCQNKSQTGECWKKEVMSKCKKQLMQQRYLLKQQELQIEKQFQLIQTLSEQVKKLAQQPINNSISV